MVRNIMIAAFVIGFSAGVAFMIFMMWGIKEFL
jgi:hypothetical protein